MSTTAFEVGSVSQYGKFRTGLILYTKDGRKFGNAIVLRINLIASTTTSILTGTANIVFETDFGNVVTLNTSNIEDYFYIIPENVQNIDEWRKAKVKLSAERL